MEHLIAPQKYVNPMIDVAFKYLFGTEKNKHLLKELLENVFKRKILDITYDNTEQIGDTLENRSAYFDVVCKATDGPDFIVECQVRTQTYFAERALFYTSRMIANQAPKGDWDYNFRPVYFLGLVNFELPESVGKTNGHIQSYSLRNDDNNTPMTDKVRYVFMEVEPFEKAYEDCTTFEEKFLYYMKNLPTFVDKPDTHNDKFFEELLMEAEYLKMDTETQAQYDRRVKQMRDAKNVEDYMIKTSIAKGLKQGLEEGLAKGLEKGLEEGLEKGRAEGLAEGEAKARIELTQSMLADGLNAAFVSKHAHLPLEVVLALQKQYGKPDGEPHDA